MNVRLPARVDRIIATIALMALSAAASAHPEEEELTHQWASAVYRNEVLFQTRIMVVALILVVGFSLLTKLIRRRRAA